MEGRAVEAGDSDATVTGCAVNIVSGRCRVVQHVDCRLTGRFVTEGTIINRIGPASVTDITSPGLTGRRLLVVSHRDTDRVNPGSVALFTGNGRVGRIDQISKGQNIVTRGTVVGAEVRCCMVHQRIAVFNRHVIDQQRLVTGGTIERGRYSVDPGMTAGTETAGIAGR